MKKGLFSLLMLFSLCGKAQTDTSAIELATPPDSTAIGAPDGKSLAKEIGPSGGKIISEDGRIELIFPAGALTETKTINIQPTINHAPNGVGKSYWFEPSGIQFKKPVQILFHYTDEEAEICPPDLMGLAMQDHKGKWSFINYEEWDSAGKTLKGFIHHFTGASNVYMLHLKLAKSRVCVKESTKIEVLEFNKWFNVSVEAFFTAGQRNQNHWYVNEVEYGNEKLGHLSIYEETSNATKTMNTHATYIAPKYLLQDGNPVTISCDVKILSGKRKGQYRTLRCRIQVYDVYQITVNYTVDFPGANGTELTDSSSFFVWVYPKDILIDNIKNYVPYVSKQGKGPCTLIIYTAGYNGYVHLHNGYRNYKLSNHNPPEVLFEFLPMYETSIFQYKWICKKFPPSPTAVAYGIPLTPEINFIANGLTQRINFNRYGTVYKIVVVPYRP